MEWGQFVTRPPVEAAGSYFLFAVCAYLYPPLIRSTYYAGEPPTDDRGHGYLRNYVPGSPRIRASRCNPDETPRYSARRPA